MTLPYCLMYNTKHVNMFLDKNFGAIFDEKKFFKEKIVTIFLPATRLGTCM